MAYSKNPTILEEFEILQSKPWKEAPNSKERKAFSKKKKKKRKERKAFSSLHLILEIHILVFTKQNYNDVYKASQTRLNRILDFMLFTPTIYKIHLSPSSPCND